MRCWKGLGVGAKDGLMRGVGEKARRLAGKGRCPKALALSRTVSIWCIVNGKLCMESSGLGTLL